MEGLEAKLKADGFALVAGVLSAQEIEVCRAEVDRLSTRKGSGCVRYICGMSDHIFNLAQQVGENYAKRLSCVRSLFFDKTATRNWPVAWHQDLTIAVASKRDVVGYGPWSVKDGVDCVQPPLEVLESMLTVRIHLDDTPVENGALKVVPGSHRLGKIATEDVNSYIRNEVVCGCQAGSALLMSPLILHSSARSENPKHRRVLHFEFAEKSLLAEELDWK